MGTPTPGSEGTSAVAVLDLELTDTASWPGSSPRDEALVLVRLHGLPTGVVQLALAGRPLDAPGVRRELADGVAPGLRTHLELDGVVQDDLLAGVEAARDLTCHARRATPEGSSVTVVVCTTGEDERLRRTVGSVLTQSVSTLELVVVDNRPVTGGARALLSGIEDERLRIVPEPKPGLSAARNAGVRAATGEVVAFTDDDAFADPGWVAHLLEPFTHGDDVVCSTGLVLPAELETQAQLYFEEFGAFDKGFERTVWSQVPGTTTDVGRAGEGGALFPYSAGVYGSGNNMAFRRAWLLEHPFDEALGAGTLTRGGEDLDAFLSVMLADKVLVYEPAALVWHAARREMAALETQMFGYGSGMSAVVLKHVLRPSGALAVGRRLPAGLRKLLDPRSEKNEARTSRFPAHLVRAELRGYLAGPLLYVRSRRRDRRHDRGLVPGGRRSRPVHR